MNCFYRILINCKGLTIETTFLLLIIRDNKESTSAISGVSKVIIWLCLRVETLWKYDINSLPEIVDLKIIALNESPLEVMIIIIKITYLVTEN